MVEQGGGERRSGSVPPSSDSVTDSRGTDRGRGVPGGRRVTVRGPPPEGFRDPWQGNTANRISPHWSRAMPEGERGN